LWRSWLGLSSPGFSAHYSPSPSPASSKSSCVTFGTTEKAASKMSPPQGKKRFPSPPCRRRQVARQEPDHTCRVGDSRRPGLYGRLFPDRSARVAVPERLPLQPERSQPRRRNLPRRLSNVALVMMKAAVRAAPCCVRAAPRRTRCVPQRRPGNTKCQGPTGTTVAKEPELRPETVKKQPEPDGQA
jgi:hypothetical protein